MSGRNPDAENRPVEGRATVAPPANAGAHPAIRALEWNMGMGR